MRKGWGVLHINHSDESEVFCNSEACRFVIITYYLGC